MYKPFLKRIPIEAWIIFILSSGSLMFYHKFDKNKDIERYFHTKERIKYYMFITAYYIVFIAFVIHLRFLLYELYLSG